MMGDPRSSLLGDLVFCRQIKVIGPIEQTPQGILEPLKFIVEEYCLYHELTDEAERPAAPPAAIIFHSGVSRGVVAPSACLIGL